MIEVVLVPLEFGKVKTIRCSTEITNVKILFSRVECFFLFLNFEF